MDLAPGSAWARDASHTQTQTHTEALTFPGKRKCQDHTYTVTTQFMGLVRCVKYNLNWQSVLRNLLSAWISTMRKTLHSFSKCLTLRTIGGRAKHHIIGRSVEIARHTHHTFPLHMCMCAWSLCPSNKKIPALEAQ